MINIVITAGGTSEKIDNVRKITNSSSGKLGSMICDKLNASLKDKHKIYYVCSKKSLKPNDLSNVEIIEIEDTNDLVNVTKKLLTNHKIDYYIHSMAVSDYTVEYVTNEEKYKKFLETGNKTFISTKREKKISSYEDNLIIKLKKTPKVIEMVKNLSPNIYLVGFKLLDSVDKDELINIAYNLKIKNKCNLVLANDLYSIRNGNHIGYLIKEKDNYIKLDSKEKIASKLVEVMLND